MIWLLAGIFAFTCWLPSQGKADTVLGGVARTVEDIGNQIVGNPVARKNERLQQEVEGRGPGSPDQRNLQILQQNGYNQNQYKDDETMRTEQAIINENSPESLMPNMRRQQ